MALRTIGLDEVSLKDYFDLRRLYGRFALVPSRHINATHTGHLIQWTPPLQTTYVLVRIMHQIDITYFVAAHYERKMTRLADRFVCGTKKRYDLWHRTLLTVDCMQVHLI